MTSIEALDLVDGAAKFVNATREQHIALIEAMKILRALVDKEEK